MASPRVTEDRNYKFKFVIDVRHGWKLDHKVFIFLNRIWQIFTTRKLWAIILCNVPYYYYGDVAPKP